MTANRRALLPTALLLAVLTVVSGWHDPVLAAFTGTTSSTGSTFGSAVTFPTYPAAVQADAPWAYYRLDEPPGSLTAVDGSGNGRTGVYGTALFAGWTRLWPLDENSGGTAADLSGTADPRDLTLHGATWTASGRSGAALSFDGTAGYAATATTALTTSTSFTVSAWVYLTDSSTSRTALSQSGTVVSGFELGYSAVTDRWVFAMPRSDSTAAAADVVSSSTAPTLNRWTQLTATFNNTTTAMDLYVDGVQQAGATFAGTPWDATGAFEVGAGSSTSRTRFWSGRVDGVRVQAAAVRRAAAGELTLGPTGGASTSWQLDENSGTETADLSGNSNVATFGPAATWGTARSGTASVDLAGSADGYLAGSAPAVDTTAGFTVSAWVYLDHTTLGAMSRVALSQSAGTKSGFMLRYDQVGTRWQFVATAAGADDGSPVYDTSSSSSAAALTTWTHLTGVHDPATSTVRLYVNGVPQPPAAHPTSFAATGALQVGRVKEFGSFQTGATGFEAWGPWAGRVDDVRTFRRALEPAEVTAVFNGASAGATLGIPGALQGAQQGQSGSTAHAFGATARASYVTRQVTNPTTYSLECWFRSRGVPGAGNGQTLMAFGSAAVGNSVTADRRLYLTAAGNLVAGTGKGGAGAVAPGTYLDGGWHHVVVTVSPGTGIRLYVDGALRATAVYSAPGAHSGYWRWGGDTWGAQWPADYYWRGALDEVAVYSTVLSAERVAVHYHADH